MASVNARIGMTTPACDVDEAAARRMGLRMLPAVEPVYAVARNALLPPLHLGIRWTIEGAHRVPVRGPVILASNHVSYLDPLALAYLADRRHRKARFLAKAELFEKRGLGCALRARPPDPGARGTRADAARRRSTPPSTRCAAASA